MDAKTARRKDKYQLRLQIENEMRYFGRLSIFKAYCFSFSTHIPRAFYSGSERKKLRMAVKAITNLLSPYDKSFYSNDVLDLSVIEQPLSEVLDELLEISPDANLLVRITMVVRTKLPSAYKIIRCMTDKWYHHTSKHLYDDVYDDRYEKKEQVELGSFIINPWAAWPTP